jgi:hypothetical protein
MPEANPPAAPNPRRSPFKRLGQAPRPSPAYVDPDKLALQDQRGALPSRQTSATAERPNGRTEPGQPSAVADQQTDRTAERQNSAVSGGASDGKIGYRVSQDAIDTIKDIETQLRRKHRIKTRLRRIVEEAVYAAYDDLERNGETSELVRRLSTTEPRKNAATAER